MTGKPVSSELPASRPLHDNEIDLIELARGLWREKWTIIGVTLLVSLCALIYALLLPSIYQASSRMIPPRYADIAPLNLGRDQADLSEIEAEEVYELFIRNLTSESTRRKFFVQHYRPYFVEQGSSASRDELLTNMRRDIVVHSPSELNSPNTREILVESVDPEIAAEWNNIFLQLASEAAFEDLRANIVAEIGNERAVLERRIEVLREFARTQREDRIVRLRDALNVAEAVGVVAPQVTAGRTAAEDELSEMIDGNLAYMRGSKAIQAELELLQKRENEDPYIEELRTLQQQVHLLSLVNTEPERAALFTLDNAAEVPNAPIKPNRAMIVVVAFVLGTGLGGVIAVFRIGLRHRRQ